MLGRIKNFMDKSKGKNKGEPRPPSGKKRPERFRPNRRENKEGSSRTREQSSEHGGASRASISDDFPQREDDDDSASTRSSQEVPADEERSIFDKKAGRSSPEKQLATTENAADDRVIEASPVRNKESPINYNAGLSSPNEEEIVERVSDTMSGKDTDDMGGVNVLTSSGNRGIELSSFEIRGGDRINTKVLSAPEGNGDAYNVDNQRSMHDDGVALDMPSGSIIYSEACPIFEESVNNEKLLSSNDLSKGENYETRMVSQQEGEAQENDNTSGYQSGRKGTSFSEAEFESSNASVQGAEGIEGRFIWSKEANAELMQILHGEFDKQSQSAQEEYSLNQNEASLSSSTNTVSGSSLLPSNLWNGLETSGCNDGDSQRMEPYTESSEMDSLLLLDKDLQRQLMMLDNTGKGEEVPTSFPASPEEETSRWKCGNKYVEIMLEKLREFTVAAREREKEITDLRKSILEMGKEKEIILERLHGQEEKLQLLERQNLREESNCSTTEQCDNSTHESYTISSAQVQEKPTIAEEFKYRNNEFIEVNEMNNNDSSVSRQDNNSPERVRLEHAQSEITLLRMKIGHLQEENLKLNSEISEARETVKGLEVDLTFSSKGLKETKCLLQNLQEEKENCLSELKDSRVIELEGHLEEGNRQLLELIQENGLINNLLDETKHKLQKSSVESVIFEHDCLEMRNQLSKLTDEKNTLEGNIQALQTEKDGLHEHTLLLSHNLEVSQVCFEESVAERLLIQRKLEELEEQMQGTNKENAKLKEELQLSQEQLATLDADKLQISSELSLLKQQLEPLVNEKSKLILLLESERQSFQLVADELTKAKKELEEKQKLEEDVFVLTQKNKELEEQASQLQKAEEIEIWQLKVEAMERTIAEQEIAVRSERKAYVSCLTMMKNSEESEQSHEQSDLEMLDIMKRIEQISSDYSNLKDSHDNATKSLANMQRERDMVVGVLRNVHVMLSQLSKQPSLNADADLLPKLTDIEEEQKKVPVEESELICLYQEFSCYAKEIQASLREKLQLGQEAIRYVSQIQSLQSTISDLLQKGTEESLAWKLKMEDVKGSLFQQEVALKTERNTYLSSLIDLEQKMEKDSDAQMGFSEGFSAEDVNMVDIMERIAQLKTKQEKVVASRQSALQSIEETARKLFEFIQKQKNCNEDINNSKSLRLVMGKVVSEEVFGVDVDLQCINQKLTLLSSELGEGVSEVIEMYESMQKEIEDEGKNHTFPPPSPNEELLMQGLSGVVASREAKLSEKIDDLITQLEKANMEKENLESKIQQTEQKLSIAREKLSIAVTKGKGVVHQREVVKQALEAKTDEVERLTNKYEYELQIKDESLRQLEMKLHGVGEAGERVEALESELAYIRNSSNALRESFLLKDAVVQRIEEMFEDVNLPEGLQAKEIVEKIEWLVSICNTTQGMENSASIVDAMEADMTQQKLEFDGLNQRYDDLLHKYHDLAEQSAMLEQCLIERNLVIQKCEEALDSIEMPQLVRAGESDERIDWLGRVLKEARDSVNQLQMEAQVLQSTFDSLNHELEEARKQVDMFTTELAVKEKISEELAVLSAEIDGKNQDIEKLTVDLDYTSREYERLKAEKEQKYAVLEELVVKIQTLITDSLQETGCISSDTDLLDYSSLDRCAQRMVEEYKASLQTLKELTESKNSTMEASNLHKTPEQMTQRSLEVEGLQEGNIILTSDQNKRLEEALSTVLSLEAVKEQLLEQMTKLEEEASLLKDERERLQFDLSQSEQKYLSIREKLSMAVKKGKSVQQQRDALKQSLEDKAAEVDALKQFLDEKTTDFDAVKKELQETKEMYGQLVHSVEYTKALELELSASKSYAANIKQSLNESNQAMQEIVLVLDSVSGSEEYRSRNSVEKIEMLFAYLREAQNRVSSIEQEVRNSKRATELLANERDDIRCKVDSLADDNARVEKDLLKCLEEKRIAEVEKGEAVLRLEHAMANLNSLLLEVSSFKDAKLASEREIKSLNDALASEVEELRQEQLKADMQHKLITKLQDDCCNLKEELTGLLFGMMNGLSRKAEEVKTARCAMETLTHHLHSLNTGVFSREEETDSLPVPVRLPSLFLDQKLEDKNDRSALIRSIGEAEVWRYDGAFLAPLEQHVKEMQDNLKKCSELFDDSLSSLSQETAGILNLARGETKNAVLRAFEALNTNHAFALEKKGAELGRLINAVNLLARAIVSASEKLKYPSSDPPMETENLQEMVMGAISLEDWPREQGFIERMTEFTVDVCQKLSVSVENALAFVEKRVSEREEKLALQFSLVEDHLKEQLARKESDCKDLKTQLSNAEEVMQSLSSQSDSDKSKITHLEDLILNLNSELDEMQNRLSKSQENEESLGETKRNLELLENLLKTRDQEQEGLVQALDESDLKLKDLLKKVEESEHILRQKQALIENLESSRSKALNRLSATLRKLDGIHQLSEGLLAEVENLQLQVENHNLEISQLKQKLKSGSNEVLTLQKTLDVGRAEMLQLRQNLQIMLFDSDSVKNSGTISDSVTDSEEALLHHLVEGLQDKISSLASKSEALHSQLDNKNALLLERDIRLKDYTEMVATLQASLEEHQVNLEKLKAGKVTVTTKIEEMGQKGMRSLPHAPGSSQVLSARKPSAVDPQEVLNIDLEVGSSKLDEDDDDKGHAFRPLTSSRLAPYALRFFSDRFDGFWVASGRILMRQPEARLGLALYWLVMHLWISMMIF